ncbi:hypothetical protein [Peribacillus butanolivorans]|uniref:hypothetical protein n=1 Tax=Peribacillus butanolivorans TaxID=421767 RepID=UPI003824AEC3
MKAEELLKLIEGMENEERWKLLDMIYDKYYNTRSKPKMEERLSNLEKDIEYISKKIGIHDMYFNRSNERED